jgi:3-hydroxyisobutyrate dehydrogenase-like beta-hydroxyacid dehydrogenase
MKQEIMQKNKYAFVGLGHLGANLAASLIRNGFDISVHDRDPAAMARLAALGAKPFASAAQAARFAGNAITCLPSPTVSEQVLAGPGGLLEGLPADGTWIEMSTNGRDEIMRLAALARDKGVATLECPVTGGVHRAAAGEITALIGGDKALYEAHLPAITAMTGRNFHMGEIGSAAVIKVITNMLAFIHLAAAGEAMMLAKKGGLDLAQAYHAIVASSGNSFVHETETQLVLSGSYDIGFTMDLALKDLGFALAMGKEAGVPLDLAAMVTEAFIRGKAAYGGDAWSTKLIKLLEDATDTPLRAEGFPPTLAPG